MVRFVAGKISVQFLQSMWPRCGEGQFIYKCLGIYSSLADDTCTDKYCIILHITM